MVDTSHIDKEHRSYHEFMDRHRDILSRLQSLNRDQISEPTLATYEHEFKQNLTQYRARIVRESNDSQVRTEAEHIRRGMGNSTIVIQAKRAVERDAFERLAEAEREMNHATEHLAQLKARLDPTRA